MLFEQIESEGLAHYSYLLGDRKEAVVIDPRRDCSIYVEKASRAGFRISHILETHRNEDYAVGSVDLAARTGAEVWHADAQLEYRYGNAAENGQEWTIGRFTIRALSTPGHTPGSMSYLLLDGNGNPWMVFTGDALFAGDVGRVDLPGIERTDEMATLLHETIFGVLLPLGDGVIVCPGHGAGSVCGAMIADRPLTTIGIERTGNPKLQFSDRDEFAANIAKILERPPYFREIERLNIEGAPILWNVPVPPPLTAAEFDSRRNEAVVLDTRMELGFGAAHIPGSVSIWLAGVPSFAGWFLPYDRPVLLVNETDEPTQAVRYLLRLGYDRIAGYLSGGMLSWHMAGKVSGSIRTLTVQQLCTSIDEGREPWILDVRSEDELKASGAVASARHIHITMLPERMDEIPRDRNVHIFCGSGMRSMTAASLMRRNGFTDITVVLGGLSGWNSSTCPIEL